MHFRNKDLRLVHAINLRSIVKYRNLILRPWNQPVLFKLGKITCPRKQQVYSMGFERAAHLHQPMTSQTRSTLCRAAPSKGIMICFFS